jgi:zinc/manganese transport system permease protein
VFVDIALAQIAALGATAPFWSATNSTPGNRTHAGSPHDRGALVLALTRTRERTSRRRPVIGVVYAVSSAGAVLLADRAPHGVEHVRGLLIGSLLAVQPSEVVKVAVLYAAVGLLHWLCRRPFFLISTDPEAAFARAGGVRLWDFVFYASFGVVVTSSVRVGGVLLCLLLLIVPALAGIAIGGTVRAKLLIGWAFGTLVSVIGMVASAALDLPTAATVVCALCSRCSCSGRSGVRSAGEPLRPPGARDTAAVRRALQ